ncbi:MAG: hypothetical protein WCO85_07095 [Actinomycetes bacterium]|jgi:hypothetical protein
MAKYRFKFLLAIMGLVSLILVSSEPVFAATSPGSKCTKLGQIINSGGKQLTCSLIWTTSASKPVQSKTPSKQVTLHDKSFRLESVTFNSSLGSAGGDARVTNISNHSRTAILGITIFASDGKTILVNLVGNANDVSPGQTVTVSFFSAGGDLPSGSFKYTFQVTAEF